MIRILIIFMLGFVAGVGAVFFRAKSKADIGKQSQHPNILENVGMSGKLPGLIEKQAMEKEENKKRILGVLETQTPLTNNHIEQLLGISDATATRYLDELEKEGKVRQVGKTGRHVYYEKA